ncbi:MAG: pantothenate kinase [Spirochaetae bacterium HGW-Spirochaetae-7]|nr:MAG: pantothenate kinase [Spirochaetae bacterium HGW-Spirochaetae-7]
MILTIDVGNTQILGGLFEGAELVLQFRRITSAGTSSDELGLFLRSVIRENGFDPGLVKEIVCCSVVPSINHSLGSACLKYFKMEAFFVQAGTKTGLKIKYNHPKDVGADRIANAIGGILLHPDKDLIIIDMGTATTFDAITFDRNYLGGAIAPGLKMSMLALETGTAKLPSVEIARPEHACGNSTIEAIQAGLYYGHIGLVHEFIYRFEAECFQGRKPVVIGTGGFARLFESTGLFSDIQPNLVLLGLKKALELNRT